MKYTPLALILFYVAFTYSLIFTGPIIYFGFNIPLTTIFLAATSFAMYFGYRLGVQSFDANLGRSIRPPKREFSILPLLWFCVGFALLGLIVSVIQALVGGTLNLSAAEIGQTYVDSYDQYERNTGSYSVTFLIYSLTLPASFITSIWGIYYFKRLSLALKVSVLVLIIGTLLFYTIGSGKQKQLGDTIIFLIAAVAVAQARAGRVISLKVLFAGAVVGMLALAGFAYILGERYAALSIDAFNINQRSIVLQQVDLTHPVFGLLGYDTGFGLAAFTSYLSQGYFGLSLSLESDFTWSYMIGFSYSLTVLANRLLGLPWVIDYTYPYVVARETAWSGSKWYSIFPHWASDFTFTGTVFLFGFFAFVYARCWREAVHHENPFAILLFGLMTLGAFFIPANNQLFLSPGSLFTVLVVVGLYLTFKKRFNRTTASLVAVPPR